MYSINDVTRCVDRSNAFIKSLFNFPFSIRCYYR